MHRVDLFHPDRRPTLDHLAERGDEPAVELDGEHLGSRLGERDRERPQPGTDLEDAVAGTDAGVGDDRPGEVRVGKEVLSERLRRRDPVTDGEST
jgi:hypothetical protein